MQTPPLREYQIKLTDGSYETVNASHYFNDTATNWTNFFVDSRVVFSVPSSAIMFIKSGIMFIKSGGIDATTTAGAGS
jgi:hypothetical protein